MGQVVSTAEDRAGMKRRTETSQGFISVSEPVPVSCGRQRGRRGKSSAWPARDLARGLLLGFLGLAVLALAGCAGAQPSGKAAPSPGFPVPKVSENDAWWAYRFRIAWPPEVPPDMTVDLMLAHAVVKPSLDAFADRLSYWRFHRRAARDGAGHQFSFLFYTDPATAREIYASLQSSRALKAVREQRLVTEIIMDDPEKPVRPGIADTSDRQWPPMLQRQWPAFITGVSLLWLGLVDEAVAALPPEQRNDTDRLAVYRAAEKRVADIWFKKGQHALLHHLSAVFGYRELLIVRPIRF